MQEIDCILRFKIINIFNVCDYLLTLFEIVYRINGNIFSLLLCQIHGNITSFLLFQYFITIPEIVMKNFVKFLSFNWYWLGYGCWLASQLSGSTLIIQDSDNAFGIRFETVSHRLDEVLKKIFLNKEVIKISYDIL